MFILLCVCLSTRVIMLKAYNFFFSFHAYYIWIKNCTQWLTCVVKYDDDDFFFFVHQKYISRALQRFPAHSLLPLRITFCLSFIFFFTFNTHIFVFVCSKAKQTFGALIFHRKCDYFKLV